MAQQTNNSSGAGVFFGIVLAIAVIVGAYFYIRDYNADKSMLEPAAGTETPAGGNMTGAPSGATPEPPPAR